MKNNAQTAKIISELGLTEDESQIYLALLRLGGAKASIIAKELGIKRTTIYPILKGLASHGFVTQYFKSGQRVYHAQRPTRVAGIFKNKLASFENIIPSLQILEKKQAQTVGLRFIESVEELKTFYRDALERYRGGSYYVIGDTEAWESFDPDFFQQFRYDRAKNKIKAKLLLTHKSAKLFPKDSDLLVELKYLPQTREFKSAMNIFPDQILVVSPDLASLAVVIEIPAMTDVFRSMWEIVWDSVEEK